MDRITRKELKQDRFAQEVGHTVEFLSEHRRQAIRIGVIAGAVVLLLIGIVGWRRYAHNQRQRALNEALEVYNAPILPAPMEGIRSFRTEDEKRKASVKAFSDLAARYDGSDEGTIAQYYLGVIAAAQGNLPQAEKSFKAVWESGESNYASLSGMALAEIYQSESKTGESEKILRGIMAHPTAFVSKEEAQLALGKLLIASKPNEARKLLEPLRTLTAERSTISRLALEALGELNQR